MIEVSKNISEIYEVVMREREFKNVIVCEMKWLSERCE
jgi:hypothetical protein